MSDAQIPTFIQLGDEQVDAATVDVPESRMFRDAWMLEGDVIAVDMAQAKEIARDKLRQARTPYLLTLDVQYLKASEQGGDAVAIIDQKQWFRDLPADPRIEAATEPEELEALLGTLTTEMESRGV